MIKSNLRQIIGNMIRASGWSLHNVMLHLQLEITNGTSIERELPIKYPHDQIFPTILNVHSHQISRAGFRTLTGHIKYVHGVKNVFPIKLKHRIETEQGA